MLCFSSDPPFAPHVPFLSLYDCLKQLWILWTQCAQHGLLHAVLLICWPCELARAVPQQACVCLAHVLQKLMQMKLHCLRPDWMLHMQECAVCKGCMFPQLLEHVQHAQAHTLLEGASLLLLPVWEHALPVSCLPSLVPGVLHGVQECALLVDLGACLLSSLTRCKQGCCSEEKLPAGV